MDYQQPPNGQQPPSGPQPGYPAPQGYPPPQPGYPGPQYPASPPPQGYTMPPAGYAPPNPYAPPPLQAYPLPQGALKTGPNPAAVVGMVFGILSMLLVMVHWFYNPYVLAVSDPYYYYYYGGLGFSQWFSLLPLVASIAGLVCSIIGNKVAAERNSGKGMALTGMILSIIAMAFAFIQLIACGLCIAAIGNEEFFDIVMG